MNRTRRTGPNTFVPFREIVSDSGGSASCDTQPICRTLFTIATALCHHPFSAFCLVVLQPSSAGMSTLRRTYIPISFYRIDIREDANTHQAMWCTSTFRQVFTRRLIEFLTRVLEVGGSEGGAAFGVGFSRSSLSCRKLHWSPLEH